MTSLEVTSPSCSEDAEQEPFILVVDDDEPSLRQLSALVAQAGHRCVTALSAIDALIVCDSRIPRVVVTDLCMPRINGCVLAHWLKARYPAIAMLLMTGHHLDEPETEALQTTFEEVLSKPIDPEYVLDRIDALMLET